MQNQETLIAPATSHQVGLVRGTFTPSEAADIVRALIEEKINFHKIQRLQRWEGAHTCDTSDLNDRITQLEQEKQEALAYIAELRASNKRLSIYGNLRIKIADSQ